jgi:sporulation protein YlmC with PRC-barrel domain
MNSPYLRASEVVKKPVVTLAGEDLAQVKDIVFEPARGGIRCFTLSGRGLLAGPLGRALLWDNVHALGPDAVMVRDEDSLEEDDAAARLDERERGGGNVIGARMMTESGTRLGVVTDAVIVTGKPPQIIGYEIGTAAHRSLLVPVAGPVVVSGKLVIVPDATADFTAGDLAGMPAAVESLRTRLQQER